MQQSVAEKAEVFHSLHAEPNTLVLGNCWDPGSARLLESAGFKALGTTSGGMAFSQGLPDGGPMGRDQMLEGIHRIAQRISIPLTADIENGYGSQPEDVARTIRGLIEAGSVGCNLEDATGDMNAPLFDIPVAVERIRAAREAATSVGINFFINARTDVYLAGVSIYTDPFDEAVRRSNAYLEAGADLVFVPPHSDRATIKQLLKNLEGQLSVQGNPDTPPVSALSQLGVGRVSTATSISRAIFALMKRIAQEVLEKGTFGFAEETLPYSELQDLFRK